MPFLPSYFLERLKHFSIITWCCKFMSEEEKESSYIHTPSAPVSDPLLLHYPKIRNIPSKGFLQKPSRVRSLFFLLLLFAVAPFSLCTLDPTHIR